MKTIYRISDASYHKAKLPGTNKQFCLENFASLFQIDFLIADKCEKSLNFCQSYHPIETNLGNSGALRKALEIAMDFENENFYIVEDDYLHHPKSAGLLEEGLTRLAYATLYDHPDKYQEEYNFGEICRIFRTPSTHWKHSISTTMTFAVNSKTLREDREIWWKYTEDSHPNDHTIFTQINNLAVAIPGKSFHTDLTYSEVKGVPLIDRWVYDLIEGQFFDKIGQKETVLKYLPQKQSLKRLAILEVLANN